MAEACRLRRTQAAELDGVWHVCVHADRVEGDRDACADARDDDAFVHEQRCLRGGFFDRQRRARNVARSERAIRLVAAIGECFADDAAAGGAGGGGHL